MAGKYPGKGAGPRTVSQSRTMWVKKGDIVDGKKVEKGYLAQLGKPEKRVTAAVRIVAATKSGKKAGEVYRYKAGRTVDTSVRNPVSKTRSEKVVVDASDLASTKVSKPSASQLKKASAAMQERRKNVQSDLAKGRFRSSMSMSAKQSRLRVNRLKPKKTVNRPGSGSKKSPGWFEPQD